MYRIYPGDEKMEYLTVQGEKFPSIGFGTWSLRSEKCKRAVKDALEMGYRHIDTAQFYDNERMVGEAISESQIPREEIFLTTKLWKNNVEYDRVKSSFKNSIEKLDLDYVDLLLIHWPVESVSVEETISAMNELQASDMVKRIGVSNFDVNQLREAIEVSENPIFTDQVEYNPFKSRDKLLRFCRKNDIMVTAYSPLAKGRIARNSKLSEIGEKYDKTPAQVALRWLIQQDMVSAIPKAGSSKHRRENLNIFDFELEDVEMQEIFNM